MSVRSANVPARIEKILDGLLASHVRFLQENPQVQIDHGELSRPNIRQTLPVYVAMAPGVSKAKAKRRKRSRPWFKPKLVAWRFFVQVGKSVDVAVEVHIGHGAKAHHQLQRGEFVQRVFDCINRTKKSKRLRTLDYSLRLLQVPSLYFGALWIKPIRGQEFLVPLVTAGTQPKPGSARARSEILDVLIDKAEERRDAHEDLVRRRMQSLARRKSPQSA